MRKTPFKYIEKAVEERLTSLKHIIRSQYGKVNVPKIKVRYAVDDTDELGSCTLIFDEDVIEMLDPDDDDNHNEVYGSYGYYLLTFNPVLLNEHKLPYVYNIVGHEFAHACVQHIISFRGFIFDYYNPKKKPQAHGPEFKKFCRLFDISPGMHNAMITISGDNKKWNRTNGRCHKMWCSCKEFYVTVDDFESFMNKPQQCTGCSELILPYGMYVHLSEKQSLTL